jgi:rhamnosyltransferase subunit B
MTRILLSTIGTLGDLHPFIALGLALKARGAAPLLAVSESHVDKVKLAGLDVIAIFPSFEQLAGELGLAEAAAVGRVMADQDYMIREIVLRLLPESTRRLDIAAEGAAAIVGNIFALAGPIVAEKRALPFIPAILQPTAIFSAYDPPVGQGFFTFSAIRNGPLGRAWNALALAVVRREVRRRYSGPIDQVRSAHGLGPMRATPIIEPESDRALRLGLYSAFLAPVQPDFPPNVKLVGFPIFDSTTGSAEDLDEELKAFIAAGDPPLVFTLGSFATYAPGKFYRESIAIARHMGMRAILLTGNGDSSPSGALIERSYAPHSLVFPHAAAIIHHGGIGTIGQALRAGKPQLVVPHMGDQRDNGARIERLGVGRVLAVTRYDTRRAATLLEEMISDVSWSNRAEALARIVRGENAAETAAQAILDAVATR